MADTFKLNHLLFEELNYELAIRGVLTTKPHDERRRILARLLDREKKSSSLLIALSLYTYNFDKEKTAIESTLNSIKNLINEFEGDTTDTLYKRLKSRLAHITGRIQRMPIDINVPDEVTYKNESLATCYLMDADLHEKLSASNVVGNTVSQSFGTSQPIINIPAPVVTCHSRQIPISEWGLKFSGDQKELYNFLDRVVEYARARGLDNNELFNAAAELFTGDAFLWFLQVKTNLNNWDDLVKQMKDDFLPPHAEDDIWDTIKSRKQGKTETIVLYSAVMENLFKRLSRPPAETTKLRIIRKNVLPEYMSHLAIYDVNFVSELVKLVKRLEDANYMKNRNQHKSIISEKGCSCLSHDGVVAAIQPGTSGADKAHKNYKGNNKHKGFQKKSNSHGNSNRRSVDDMVETNSKSESSNVETKTPTFSPSGNSKGLVCWNCRFPNHTFHNCRSPRTTFCFKCGTQGVTSKNCKCMGNQ
ncbi:uncharacterized protein [Leptinotarsa decemlineata]|uniref:uncharacterized protein n=1 Tax=Leptinotarsa decemlineata TaxID=7539 RepID=UPI003D308519